MFIDAKHQVLFAWVLAVERPIDGRAHIGVRLETSNMRVRRTSRCILHAVDPYQQSSIAHSSSLPARLVVSIREERQQSRHALLHSHTHSFIMVSLDDGLQPRQAGAGCSRSIFRPDVLYSFCVSLLFFVFWAVQTYRLQNFNGWWAFRFV